MSLVRKWVQSVFLFIFCLMFSCGSVEGVYYCLYATTDNGGMTFTGNTLGLTKLPKQLNPGTSDAIGCFIADGLSTGLNNYPVGTTGNYLENRSSAILDIPEGSTILHAELIWSGSFGYHTGDPKGTPTPPPPAAVTIKLTDPNGITWDVTSDPATAQQANNPKAPIYPGPTPPNPPAEGNYVRNANVTSIVANAGGGQYIAGEIYGTLVASDDTHNAAGWTLAVVYHNPNMYTNNMAIWTACEQSNYQPYVPVQICGFCTPPVGPVNARIFVSATEGDANKTGDRMLFGPTPSLDFNLNALKGSGTSGTNNPLNNFFCSQINTYLGLSPDVNGKLVVYPPGVSGRLDTRGSFGTSNANPLTAKNVVAGRQGFDITSIDVSNFMLNNQSTAYALGATSGDDYTISAFGIQIQVGSPLIVAEKLVNGETSIKANIGDTVHFTIELTNTGNYVATEVAFQDVLPPGLTYVPGTYFIDGTPHGGNPGTLIPLADLNIPPMNNTIQISFDATIDSLPVPGCQYTNAAVVNYSFEPCGSTIPPCSQLVPTPCTQTLPTPFITDTNSVTINMDQNGPIFATPLKSVDVAVASVDAIVTYTIILENTGDTKATGVTISDIVPAGLTFQTDSVYIGPNQQVGVTPANIPVGDVDIGQTVVVTFQVKVVNGNPTDCIYKNFGTITYHYTGCNGADNTVSFTTEDVVFTVSASEGAQLSALKSADVAIARFGDTVTFTIVVANSSLTGVAEAHNIKLVDVLPSGLVYVNDSLTVNGSPAGNDLSNVSIPPLPDGFHATVVFQANVESLPTAGCYYRNVATVNYQTTPCSMQTITLSVDSNEQLIRLIQQGALIDAEKSVDPLVAGLEDTVTFTIQYINRGDTTATGLVLQDRLPKGLVFVHDSFTYNGVPYSASNTHHVPLPDLEPDEIATLTFQATVEKLPVSGCIFTNSAWIDYHYLSCSGEVHSAANAEVVLTVRKTSPIVTIEKLVDSSTSTMVEVGTPVTFQLKLHNGGEIQANDVLVQDLLPSGMVFVPGSFKVNGKRVIPDPDLVAGFSRGNLNPGETLHIEFEALVKELPQNSKYVNEASVSYLYTNCDGNVFTGVSNSNQVTIFVIPPQPNPFIGKIKQCKYLNRTELVLVATWKPVTNPNLKCYRIYHNGEVVATIKPGDPTVYEGCLGSCKRVSGYSLVIVYKGNIESKPIKLRVVNE